MGLRALLVDDDLMSRTIVSAQLHECGYDVEEADSVVAAMQLLESDRDFNFVLSDVVMPEFDGRELLRRLKTTPTLSNLPVVMISAGSDVGTLMECLRLGADDFVAKPVHKAALQVLWPKLQQTRIDREKLKVTDAAPTQRSISDDLFMAENAVQPQIHAVIRLLEQAYQEDGVPARARETISEALRLINKGNLYQPLREQLKRIQNTSSRLLIESMLAPDLLGDDSSITASSTVPTTPSARGPSHADGADSASAPQSPTGSSGAAGGGGSGGAAAGEHGGATTPTGSSAQAGPSGASGALHGPDDKQLRSWAIDVWPLTERDMVSACMRMLKGLNLIAKLKLDEEKLQRFIVSLLTLYNSRNPYHNFRHAFDVMQAVYVFLTTGRASEHLTPLDQLSVLIAAIAHDVDHPGTSNIFQINTSSDLAIRYNDASVLENHHSATLFALLRREENNFIKASFTLEQTKQFRATVIKCILATDLALQPEYLIKYDGMLAPGGYDKNDRERRMLLCTLLVKAADLANAAKPFDLAKEWSDVVVAEFFLQGDRERELSLPISPGMDRFNSSQARISIGFIDFIVAPLYSRLVRFLGDLNFVIETLQSNRDIWMKIAPSV